MEFSFTSNTHFNQQTTATNLDNESAGTQDRTFEEADMLYIAIGALAVLGNALVIFIVIKSQAMRQLQSNLLILTQSGL